VATGKDSKNNPMRIVDEILELLASKKDLTVNQAGEVLIAANSQLKTKVYEAMTVEEARKVSELFEPKADIKVVQSIH
jgi:hypothetical protein